MTHLNRPQLDCLQLVGDSPLLLPRRAAVLGGHQELRSFMPLLAISESELRLKSHKNALLF
ncbi:MAG: hypothetical protein RIM23_27560 [Coleofasciculus sp. G3-WIS-01]